MLNEIFFRLFLKGWWFTIDGEDNLGACRHRLVLESSCTPALMCLSFRWCLFSVFEQLLKVFKASIIILFLLLFWRLLLFVLLSFVYDVQIFRWRAAMEYMRVEIVRLMLQLIHLLSS